MREESAPEMKVKDVTPASIIVTQKRRSSAVLADKSPYPTVDVVVKMK